MSLLVIGLVPFLIQCSFLPISTNASKSCLYNPSDLIALAEEIPESLTVERWYNFPEGTNIMPEARATLEPYSDQFKDQYKFAEKVSFNGKNFIIAVPRDYNRIEILTDADFEIVKTLPVRFYAHYLFAKRWETEKGEYLVIFVDLKATKNMSMLFVLSEDLNLSFRDCFSRPIALGFGQSDFLGDIFAIKYRVRYQPYGISVFYWGADQNGTERKNGSDAKSGHPLRREAVH